MSSFVANSLIAASIYGTKVQKTKGKTFNFFWLISLIVLASFPDIDYVVPALHSSANQGLRITHSILFSLFCFTIAFIFLLLLKSRKNELKIYGLQAIYASFSHLVLDLLVGVTPLPLLFPFNSKKIKLPFGILPSAGKIDLTNSYLYRNLYLEMGVLLPLCLVLYLLNRRGINLVFRAIALLLLFLCSGYYMHQCYLLPR